MAYLEGTGAFSYVPDYGYAGADSTYYKLCDNLGMCSCATISLNVTNGAPAASPDIYGGVRASTMTQAYLYEVPAPGILANDSDPDGDSFSIQRPGGGYNTGHGSVGVFEDGSIRYIPNIGFTGVDTFPYTICDNLGKCSAATIFFLVDNDAGNAGAASCNANVGGPVNVTNGNMYLQQADYRLPGVGAAVEIARTYNSISQGTGLFGRGWSTAYDESVVVQDSNILRLNLPDGRAVYFYGAAGALTPVEPDFHGQVIKNGDGTFTLSLKDGSLHQFDAAGKLLSLTDRSGNQTALAYDANSHLVSITDAFGRALTATTSATGRVLSVGDQLGTIATYAYGPNEELLSATYADNSGFQFGYDGAYRLTSVTDAMGNVVESHTYDGQGRALTSEKQNGVERYTLSYVSASETDVTDALGRVTKYTFDTSKGRNVVTKVEGVCGCGGGGSQVQTWTYDGQLNVVSRTDALGHAVSFTYDGDGNLLTETNATGMVSYTYNQFNEMLTRTDQLNNVTTDTHDAWGNLLTLTNALNKATTFSYDQRGQLLSITNARSKVTAFAYDASGNLIQKTDAAGHASTFTYDARSRLTSATDALGGVTRYDYDAAGRVVKVTQPNAAFVTFNYDLAGRRTGVTDARGNSTSYGYDAASRLTSQTNAVGGVTSFAYDQMSNLTSSANALGRATNYEYDDFNRLSKVIYPAATAGAARLETRVEYDAVGNVRKRVDAAGRETLYDYDEVSRLVKVTDPLQQLTQYEYNARSEVTAVVDALGQRYEFVHDKLGQVRRVKRNGQTTAYTYDAVGSRKTRTDNNGATTTYSYDALNRLTDISYPDATTVAYSYDKLGRLKTATNENGTLSFGYNRVSRLTSVTDVFGQALDYNYDDNGNRTKASLNGATIATYRYDAVDRLTRLIDGAGAATTYTYDAASRLLSRRLPNGVVTTQEYDGLDRLTRLRHSKGAAAIADNLYQYNDANDITSWANASGTHAYTYDALDRLTFATNSVQPNESYAYDAVGNRTASQFSLSYQYQPFNRLAGTDAATYGYDSNGSLLSKTDGTGTWSYLWDFENRLKQVTRPDGTTVSYKYDALGRRVKRGRSDGSSTSYIYDGADVVRDINGDGSTVDYLNGPGVDDKLRQASAAGTYYFIQDHLGSTRSLTNTNGNVVESVSYDSFGNGASFLTRYGYTGREWDSNAGLYYYRNRWYDPAQGRFISEDPIGLNGGINLYAYASNDPVGKTDPSGLYEIDVHYYLTYYLALKTGCFKDWEAHDIAHEDQQTDENSSTMPGPGTTEQQRIQNRMYHALSQDAAEGVGSRLLWQGAMNEANGHHVWIGRYLHYLQDTFSHAGYTDDTWGHTPLNVPLGSGDYGDHDTDKTAYDPPKARRMVGATWKALLDYAKAKKCGCQPRWDNSWWKEINEFINVLTDSPRSSTIDATQRGLANPSLGDPDALTRKRRILGLPDRSSGQW
jgi:RHS repeat-associated protein